MFSVVCPCGRSVQVRASAAGTTTSCPSCGGQLTIPSLSLLKRQRDPNGHADVDHGDVDVTGQQSLKFTGRPTGEQGRPEQGRPEQGRPEQGRPEQGRPERVFSHFWGDVGTNARISATSMGNYASLLIQTVENFFQTFDQENRFELLISCALLPQAPALFEIESVPGNASTAWAESLRARMAQVCAPPVVDGPVAFVMYRRMNMGAETAVGIRPFNRHHQAIEKLGFDLALMQAAGLQFQPPTETRPNQSWWRRGLMLLGVTFKQEPTPGKVHEGHKTWLDYTESRLDEIGIEELKRSVQREPAGLNHRIRLAAKYAASEQYAEAAEQYSSAIRLVPNCSILYERRSRAHLDAGSYRDALADLDTAIAMVPFESWYYFSRSHVFAGLEAWSRAIAELDHAHQLAPREPVFLLRRAELNLRTNDHDSALQDLTSLLKLDPNSGAAHSMLGWVYQQQKIHDLNLAVKHLNLAVELIPDDLTPLYSRSLAYASQNKFELALEDCDTILRIRPDSGVAHGIRGRMLQMQGEFAAAIEACTTAIELGAEGPMVFVARGICYSATDQQELALADCDAALALDPQNPLALHLRGTLNIQRGELESAMEAFAKAKQIAPDWTEPREQIALLHRINENPHAAIEEQSNLVLQEPKNPSHYVNRAFAYTQAGNYEAAESDYRTACELDPENEQIYYLRGCFFIDRQEEDRALEDLNRVLQMAPEHDYARFRRAAILLRLKRQDEALQDYEKLIERYPDQPHAYSGRAFAHQLLGDETAAEADIHRLAEIAPETVEETTIHALRAKVHRLEGEERYAEAIETAEEIIEFAPQHSAGYRLRAWIRWYTEQHVEATEDYSRLLEIEPDDPDVLSSRGQVYAEMGEWESAMRDLNAAVDKSRELGLHQLLAYALNGRALALAGMDRMDDSTRDYDESVRLCPTNPWVYYNRGIVMFQRGDAQQAKQLLQMALDAPTPPLTKRKRDRAEVVLGRLSADAS